MAESLILAVGDADALRDAVIARYEAGPFTPTTVDDRWLRQVEIGDGFIREIGDRLGERDYLARHVAEHTREPVVLQWPESDRGYELAAGDDPALALRDVDVRTPPTGRAVHHLVYALDLARQRSIAHAFEGQVEAKLLGLFPIQNRRKTARLDCSSIKAYGPTQAYGPGTFRYDRYLEAQLQLALFEWSADGNERSLIELRKGSATLGRYDLLTPPGGVIRRGEEIVVPYDEYAAELLAGWKRHVRHIRDAINRSDWSRVTPRSLVES